MLCQQSIRLAGKLRQLSLCQPSLSALIPKSNIYDDSMSTYKQTPKTELTEIKKRPERLDKDSMLTLIFGPLANTKRDWLETFRNFDFSAEGMRDWWIAQKLDIEKARQEFIEERHRILGSELAAGHFTVALGGKVKFTNSDKWIQMDKHKNYPLPNKYDPDYIVEAIDFSGVDLHYEGLFCFANLARIEWLSLKGNSLLDDWSIDKLSTMFTTLEYLDISECKLVSERGLEALYRMNTLKTLKVTNWHGSEAMEYTCLLLEDVNPNLTIEILPPPEKKKEEKKV